MNIYQKLNAAREKFHSAEITKSGKNTFAGYSYFELADFVVPALAIFKEVGLTSVTSFVDGLASMTIIDCNKPDDKIIITSPMGSANLKGCHEVQNIGAVETYQRRYLWMAALEIVEHDAIDSSDIGAPKHKPAKTEHVSPARIKVIERVARAMVEKFERDDLPGAYEESEGITDAEERIALWDQLADHSRVRNAVKAYKAQLGEKQ